VCENLEKQEFDREILTDYKPRFPRKSAEEINLIDSIMSRLDTLIAEDAKFLAKSTSAASTELMSELDIGSSATKSKLYYESGNVEALERYRAMTEQERNSLKSKNDEVDAEKTDDLEKWEDDPETGTFNEISLEFYSHNRVNLARAFLGMDGGYSVRKLKKFMRRERERLLKEKDDDKKSYDARRAAAAGEEAKVEGEPAEANLEAEAPYSDESDIDEILKVMDDETFERYVEEAKKVDFKTEEEAKAWFEEKLKDWAKTRVKKRKTQVDTRETTDPYYAMMKTEKPISSRYQNQWDLDDEDYHMAMDQVEKSIGRYPVGFRHYENFENYHAVFPLSTIDDYHNDSKLVS
jgi:hypothetical protein